MTERGNASGSTPETLAKILQFQPRQSYLEDVIARLQSHIDGYQTGEVSPDATAWALIFTMTDLTKVTLTGAFA